MTKRQKAKKAAKLAKKQAAEKPVEEPALAVKTILRKKDTGEKSV